MIEGKLYDIGDTDKGVKMHADLIWDTAAVASAARVHF